MVKKRLTQRHQDTKKTGTMNEELEQIAKDVVDASMKLHIALEPGLLESVYAVILQKKLEKSPKDWTSFFC